MRVSAWWLYPVLVVGIPLALAAYVGVAGGILYLLLAL
jgi:hypothetical protein